MKFCKCVTHDSAKKNSLQLPEILKLSEVSANKPRFGEMLKMKKAHCVKAQK